MGGERHTNGHYQQAEQHGINPPSGIGIPQSWTGIQERSDRISPQ